MGEQAGHVTISYTYRRDGRIRTRDGFTSTTAARAWAHEHDAVIQGTASNPYDRAALLLASMPTGPLAHLIAALQAA